MKQAWIVDIDGTLANTDHRIHHIKPPEGKKKNWGAFFGEAYKDEVYPHTTQILKLLKRDTLNPCSIILMTARPENLAEDTKAWLRDKGLSWDMILMRPVNERKPDFEVKRDLYRKHVKPHFEVVAALEDRLQVAKMWREEGVPVLLCGDEWLKQDWSE